MSNETLKQTPARLEELEKFAEEQRAKEESRATRMAAMEMKLAQVGKLEFGQLVKVGMLACTVAGIVSGLVQLAVKNGTADLNGRIIRVETKMEERQGDKEKMWRLIERARGTEADGE